MPCPNQDCPFTTPFLTVPEVAAMLRRSRRTIYRWLEEGTIQGKRVKDHWLIATPQLCRLVHPELDEATPAHIQGCHPLPPVSHGPRLC
jgi:excisionase family DNA binding protein